MNGVFRPSFGFSQLAQDAGEQYDLADRQPKQVKALSDLLRQWDAQLAKPLWEDGGG